MTKSRTDMSNTSSSSIFRALTAAVTAIMTLAVFGPALVMATILCILVARGS